MKQALILASAALALAAAPAAAKPDHAKGGGKHGKHSYGYSEAGCPPGLAKKGNGCLPPGQAKKLARGQRYLPSYGYDRYAYSRIPYDLREQYDFDPQDRYYYNDGYIYQVDPTTLIVEQVIRALLR